MTTPVRIFEDEAALALAVAEAIAGAIDASGRLVLGCPAGRTPRASLAAFGRLAAAGGIDLSRSHVVMMDEYVERLTDRWALCPAEAHYSCRAFAEQDLRQVFNAGLPPELRLPAHQVHVPDPADPEAYDRLIAELGGVDLFLLASGASDGHVAFNPPGTPLSTPTHVAELALSTRRDNLATFPGFRSIEETPTHGVGVGPGTIAGLSRSAILLLVGPGKRAAFQRVTRASDYDPAWPATVIHRCRDAKIFADAAAAGAARAA